MNPNPKLVCLTFDYPPMKGGVARYLSNLAEASQGEIEVLVPLEHPTSANGEQRVAFWWSGWPKWLPLINRCLEVPADKIILVSHVLPIGTAAWISRLFGGPDYIALFHGTDLKRVNTRWRKFLLNKICGKAKTLVCNSRATARVLERLNPGSSPLILTPGLKPFPKKDKELARRELGVHQNSKVILSVARLIERKGIDTLIAAAPRILSAHPEAEFVVIGDGPYGDALEKLAQLNHVRVKWIKDATDQDVYDWYAAADIFCLPAREQADDVEGFGIVFLESAYAGLPVIAGRGWGTGEAIEDGKTGFLIDPNSDQVALTVIELLDNPELADRMGRAGRERAIKDFKRECEY